MKLSYLFLRWLFLYPVVNLAGIYLAITLVLKFFSDGQKQGHFYGKGQKMGQNGSGLA